MISMVNHEEVRNLYRLIMNKEVESVVKNAPKRKAQDQNTSLVIYIKHLKKD